MKLINKLKYNWIIIKQRWKAESPEFFKKIKNTALKIGGSGLAVIAINATLPVSLPAGVITAVSYIITICAAIAGTAQLTKE